MKIFYCILIAGLIGSVVVGCNKDCDDHEDYDCVFVQNDADRDGDIDETENRKQRECLEDAFTTQKEIEENLIGEWKIVGFGHAWVPTFSQPCAYLTITEDELLFDFENGWVDTLAVHDWYIEEVVRPGEPSVFFLRTDADYTDALDMHAFCEDYMFGNSMISDGNLYIYEKVK